MFLGLFSTHLPYIIIGIVYFMSFTVASLQFMSNTLEDNDAVDMKSNQAFITAEIGDCHLTFQFTGEGHAFAGFTKQTIPFNIPETSAHRIRIPDDPLVADYHHQTIFARPPPVLPVSILFI